MKTNRTSWRGISLLGLLLLTFNALAQTPTPTSPTRDGRVLVPVDGTVDPNTTTPAFGSLDRTPLPQPVTVRIEKFKLSARAYLERQEALRKRLLGATDEERARIREQLRAARQEWLEHSRQLREEFKTRQSELREKLSGYRELLDESLQDAKTQLQDKKNEVRGRRGIDR